MNIIAIHMAGTGKYLLNNFQVNKGLQYRIIFRCLVTEKIRRKTNEIFREFLWENRNLKILWNVIIDVGRISEG